MKLNFKNMAFGLVLTGGFVGNAIADGTTAGEIVSNLATLSYSADGGATTIDLESSLAGNSTTGTGNGENTDFAVDRKIDFAVVTDDAALVQTQSNPTGGTMVEEQVLTFTVTNDGNSAMGFSLASLARTGSATAFGETDNFDMTGVTIYVDTDDSGDFDITSDLPQNHIGTLAEDASIKVFIVASTTLGQAAGDVALYSLVAGAAEPSANLATAPVYLTEDDRLNADTTNPTGLVASIQDVWAEGDSGDRTHDFGANGSGSFTGDGSGDDVEYNGMHSAISGYIIVQPEIMLQKESEVVWDEFSCSVATAPTNSTETVATLCGTGNPKAIPGAYVRYTLTITNTGTTAATGASISDPIDPANPTDKNTLLVLGTVAVENGAGNAPTSSTPDSSGTTTTNLAVSNIDIEEAGATDDVIVITFFVTIQ